MQWYTAIQNMLQDQQTPSVTAVAAAALLQTQTKLCPYINVTKRLI
jgi:hypothetical protein